MNYSKLVGKLYDRIHELEAELKRLRPEPAALLKPMKGTGTSVEFIPYKFDPDGGIAGACDTIKVKDE